MKDDKETEQTYEVQQKQSRVRQIHYYKSVIDFYSLHKMLVERLSVLTSKSLLFVIDFGSLVFVIYQGAFISYRYIEIMIIAIYN